MKKILLFGLIASSNSLFAQLDEFETTLSPMFSQPAQDGWMYFNVPNTYQPGACFQFYKIEKEDIDNNMKLIDVHTDSLVKYKHYKFQQTFKNVPVEGVGCIEHFDLNGNLIFTNAKHAIDLTVNPFPSYNDTQILDAFFNQLPPSLHFAWEHPHWEQEKRIDDADSNATWYPVPELLIAIDEVKDMGADILGSRYRLAYKISVKTISPTTETTIYYIDAHTAQIFRTENGHIYDGPADIYGYGSRIIDTQYKGFPTNKYILKTNDNTRVIHTKKNPTGPFSLAQNTKDADDNWGNTFQTETSTHYHVSTSWDYFRIIFGRTGQNNDSREIRVHTQLEEINAYFDPDGGSHNNLVFGKENGWDFGMEPSVVAHEFTHGVTHHTSNLTYQNESGALNESFSDIFGIVIQAQMLDGGSTDWILGNFLPISVTRSLINPNSMGTNYDANGNLITGQPDTYFGDLWYSGAGDNGGVHINSGVQNHWFYILSVGDNDYNDLGDYYDVNGIGMTKAARISYFALTSLMSSSSQYFDARNATIEAAKILFGECSVEHQNTIDAWYAVGVGSENNCTYTLSVSEITEENLSVYPNPTNSLLNIELPSKLISSAKVYDVTGRLVLEQSCNDTFFQINVSNLEKGAYSILFEFEGQQFVKRFVTQ